MSHTDTSPTIPRRHDRTGTTPDRLLRQAEVMRMTGLSRMGIYLLEQRGEFPRRRRIGTRHVAWLESEVLEWMRSLPVVGAETDDPDPAA